MVSIHSGFVLYGGRSSSDALELLVERRPSWHRSETNRRLFSGRDGVVFTPNTREDQLTLLAGC